MADPQSVQQVSTNPSFSSAEHKTSRFHPGAKRYTLDHATSRLRQSRLSGSDHAIEYLHKKYTCNLSSSTIKQAGDVILSFLVFLQNNNTVIGGISRQSVAAFVEYDQDRGLTAGSVKTRLRALYTFLRFLVDCYLLLVPLFSIDKILGK